MIEGVHCYIIFLSAPLGPPLIGIMKCAHALYESGNRCGRSHLILIVAGA